MGRRDASLQQRRGWSRYMDMCRMDESGDSGDDEKRSARQ
jgi:hypothetical protein